MILDCFARNDGLENKQYDFNVCFENSPYFKGVPKTVIGVVMQYHSNPLNPSTTRRNATIKTGFGAVAPISNFSDSTAEKIKKIA